MICYDLFFLFFVPIKISYYWFKRRELSQKAKEKYYHCGCKEKAAEYYIKNKDAINEKSNSKYKNFSKEQKNSKKRI